MASFSYQHHPVPLDSVFMANNDSGMTKNMSGLSFDHQIDEGINYAQFYYPTSDQSQAQSHTVHEIPVDHISGIVINNSTCVDHNTRVTNTSLSSDDNEPSSVTKKQSTDSSTVVDKFESGDEQVTQKLTIPMEKKRKTRNGSASNSAQFKDARQVSRGKKQKNCNNEDEINEDEKKVKLNGKNDEAKNKGQEEPSTGYIHVRARRGQATDSHSLAERVRREKISERMKMLQRLVPGCEKVTGKALMLDEIINYVQSLQNQVEFLSMKLASLNPMFYDFGMDIDAFMVRPEGLNTLASQIPSVPQCSQSQPTAFTTENNTITANNNYLMDNSASLLLQQQGQRPNAFSHDSGSLLWDMEDQRHSLLNPSGFSNLCSFN